MLPMTNIQIGLNSKERMKQEQAARHEEHEKRMQEQQEKIRERIEKNKPKL